MYLNDFRVSEILKVIQEIREIDPPDLIYHIGIDWRNEDKFAFLLYIPEVHRLDAFYFNPISKPLYPNPEVIASIAPKKTFIKRLVPNNTYKLLMSAR